MDADNNASKRQCTLEMFVNSVKKKQTEEPIIISESDEDDNTDFDSVFSDNDGEQDYDYLDEALTRQENKFVSQADATEYDSERNDNVDSSGNDTDVSSVDIEPDITEENYTSNTDQAQDDSGRARSGEPSSTTTDSSCHSRCCSESSDTDKPFQPSINYAILSKKQQGKRTRHFKISWYKSYKWLHYCTSQHILSQSL